MAVAEKDSILKGLKGKLGKELIVKQCRGKIIVTAYPDMTRVVWSELQGFQRAKMSDAVAYAKQIIADRVKKAAIQQLAPEGQSAYHFLVSEYMLGRIYR